VLNELREAQHRKEKQMKVIAILVALVMLVGGIAFAYEAPRHDDITNIYNNTSCKDHNLQSGIDGHLILYRSPHGVFQGGLQYIGIYNHGEKVNHTGMLEVTFSLPDFLAVKK
jgi:hypothetical protein